MDYFQLLCSIAALFLAVYYYYTSTYNFWKRLDIPGPKPTLFFGNFLDLVIKKISIPDYIKKWYNHYKNEPVFGIYAGTSPLLFINDLDMIKSVLIKDFALFADRGFEVFEKIEPLGQNLFMLKAEKWRPLRAKLSPIFTSGKLKEMFPLIADCAKNLETYLDKLVEKDEPVNCRDLAGKFTTDAIGSCAFGLEINSLGNENCEFRKMSTRMFQPSLKQTIRDVCREFTPSLYKLIGSYLQIKEIDDFYINLFTSTMRYREENNVVRPDFVHLLMELKKQQNKFDNIELTDLLLTAQATVFFIGGFETTSSTMAHALYELAQNQEIQNKLREEIRNVYNKNNGALTYADIKGMNYLDKVFKESLRKYPVLPMLNRQALENYTFAGTKFTIPAGTKLAIPVYGIQTDPDIYPEPEKFDPERFEEDAVAARHPMSFLAFGDGPRNCVGNVTFYY
ncbi:hypothetical protein K0M31_009906 [Melipona bicolor]|uniref:Cytochrome P450 n=1 Tax=Melipona bicolor TaxID=60889 RepID=A0AA40FNA3_9HYME|nr:hypothetical protein K0M31_009906 [Melipona bicolor]